MRGMKKLLVLTAIGMAGVMVSVAGMAEEKIEGKVSRTKLTACHPRASGGGCEGNLTLETNVDGKAQQMPIKVVADTIIRKGKKDSFRLVSTQAQGQAVIGVHVQESFVFPFSVKINVTNIGGPSAGLMFALGIIDKLTPMNLTAGRFIAGTGEIEANGTVDPIGGIQQKMAGARAAGATIFLTPAANCPDTAGAVPAGLRLIKVSSLRGAVADLQALKAGGHVPSC